MIPAVLYHWIYFIIVTVMTLVVAYSYIHQPNLVHSDTISKELPTIATALFFILFIGFRPVSGEYFGDMACVNDYYYRSLDGIPFSFNINSTNKIWDNLLALWGALGLGATSYFGLVSAIYFGCAYIGIRRLFPAHKLAAYLVFLAAFSTFSYGTNGIKAGAATSIFILAYSYRENLKICIPLMLISWGFHHSMHFPLAAFAVTLLLRNTKLYLCFWILCLIAAIAHTDVFVHLLAAMTDNVGAIFLLDTEDNPLTGGGGVFRPDFVLYSAVPAIIGCYAIFIKKMQISDTYRNLLNFYLCTNGIWMLCMYVNFTNRIAYLSWFVYPLLLIYPFLNEDWGKRRYTVFSAVMIAHLCLTLVLHFV